MPKLATKIQQNNIAEISNKNSQEEVLIIIASYGNKLSKFVSHLLLLIPAIFIAVVFIAISSNNYSNTRI